MSLLNELKKEEVWQDFLKEKSENNQLDKKELKQLADFVMNKNYLNIDLNNFSYPQKIIISKIETSKKRVVYTYNKDETLLLSLLAYLLKKYDYKLSDRCFSFRSSYTPKRAFDIIKNIRNLQNKYVLKVDIHNYFNSIDVDMLLEILETIIDDDPELISFISKLLKQDKCVYKGELIEEKRGAMAGVPIANFFANIYLLSLDRMFEEKNIQYFRYSDDIIMFFDDQEQLQESHELLKQHISDKHLTFNPDKLMIKKPGEEWEFLGFAYKDGKIDLSTGAIIKLKGKIKRKVKKIYRWKKRNKIDFNKAARVMISNFDNKFYDLNGKGGFTWMRFYFPILSSNKGLKIIDEYMLKYLRYLYSGRHYKGNYKVTYEQLKNLGYTPLVAEYYNWQEENNRLLRQNKGEDQYEQ